MSTAALPNYDELPIADGLPPGSSWHLWGPEDRLGTLNLIDDDALARGVQSITSREVFSLNLALDQPSPPLFGRSAFEHHIYGKVDEEGHDDALSNWNTQSSSQWDGFRHIRHPEHGYYNGAPDESHGVDHFARRGIATRAVLVDVGRYLESEGRELVMDQAQLITPADVLGALRTQGSTVEPGDVLLIRTGWLEWYSQQDEATRVAMAESFAAPGLAPGRATAQMLWDLHVAAVAADNPALEVWPVTGHMALDDVRRLREEGRHEEYFVHFAILPLLGIPIGEFFELGALAAACARDRRYTSLLTSAPLNLARGVASPPNALAIR